MPTKDYTFNWQAFPWREATTKKVKWPQTNMEIDTILSYLTEGGRPPDVSYGTNIRYLLDACTWEDSSAGRVRIVDFGKKKVMLNAFLNTFETVEETIFWLKFADRAAIDDRMEKTRILVALSEEDIKLETR